MEPIRLLLASKSQAHDQFFVSSICTNIEDIFAKNVYPEDASTLLFKLLSIVCTISDVSWKPVEKLYLKLLLCTHDTSEYIKVGEVVAYLLKMYSVHGATGIAEASLRLPYTQSSEADDDAKAWEIQLGSKKSLQEFVKFWCNIYNQLSKEPSFDTHPLLFDSSSIISVYTSLAYQCEMSTDYILAICKAIVALTDDRDTRVLLLHRQNYTIGVLSW